MISSSREEQEPKVVIGWSSTLKKTVYDVRELSALRKPASPGGTGYVFSIRQPINMNVIVRLTSFRHHLQKRKDRCSSSNRIKGKIVVVGMSENDDNNEEYNNYVLNNGIWAKIDAQTNASILDMIYTRARKKIRERGGMLTTRDAVKLVLKEDRDEMLNDIVEELRRKDGFPLTAEAFTDERTRNDALRALRLMITELEDPN